jgi:murein DD-endopeptidase MepM/ murein hydrolase activator NlpD
MSLISKDFRTNQHHTETRTPIRLRWVLLIAAFTGIGAVIASTDKNTSENNTLTSDILPAFNTETPLATNETTVSVQLNPAQLKSGSEHIALNIEAKPKTERTSDNLSRSSFSLGLPQQTQRAIISDADNFATEEWREYKVKSGDSLARLFDRAGVAPAQLDQLMKSGKDTKKLKRIFPGDIIKIMSDEDGVLQSLRYDMNHKSYLLVEREGDDLIAKIHKHELDRLEAHASGIIESSLFLAAQDAGISQNIIMELANIFGWDIDFALDIRKGDSFNVLYEELFRDGEKISDGDILAAEFINNGKTYRAVRYTDPQSNRSEYFTPNGKSMKKAFLRTPVNFTRISSKFTTSRYHPVLHRFRSHKGVDYAAKRGTPIYAAGNGKVIFKGKKGGYGNVIILQHGTKYTTLYAHVKSYNRKLRVGSRVSQGQTIAYVGSSGLATGPHLHYEFRVNGTHRNPLTVHLPTSNPVPKRYKTDFGLMTSPILAQLDSLSRSNQIALVDDE